jgi:hypothetical protein
MQNLPWRAFLVGLLLALGIGYALRPTAQPGALPAASPTPTSAAPAAAPAPPADPTMARATGTPLAKAGGTLQIDRASFPASGPVRVSLELPVASADDSPRPVRLVSQPDHRILEINGAVGSDRSAATIDVDAGYLQPGTYLVEMKTTEASHFPLRRYFIVVR